MKFGSDFEWEQISPEIDGYEFMFGYYDRCPWDQSGKYHLAMQIPQLDNRLPQIGENAIIGILDENKNWEPLVETKTWCHQQGCMELFLKHRPNCFVFNDYDEDDQKMVARIYELGKGVVGRYERPIYAISPDGRWAASLNFARIPRRGYSYAHAALDPDWFPKDLDGDGVWIMDLHTGEERLAVSYRTMIEQHPYPCVLENKYIWLNHIIFNCDSTRILWLFRSIYQPVNYTKMWQTFMYTSALDGHDVKCSLPEVYWTDMISHQIWGRTPYEIMVDANWEHSPGCFKIMVYDDRETPFRARKISDCHGMRAHLVYSPDGRVILADSYPDEKGVQTLMLVNADTGKCVTLGKFLHNAPAGTIEEKRCDLHPRWNPSGTVVTIDSIVSGKRAIYLLNLEEAMRQCSQEA